MIFTGDVAIADGDKFNFVGFPEQIYVAPICINLEGAIKSGDADFNGGVYNSITGLDSFSEFNLSVPFLANNHIHDLTDGVCKTREHFENKRIQTIGAGTFDIAQQSAFIESGKFKYAILGFGWPVIGCVPPTKNSLGVNEFNRQNVLHSVSCLLESEESQRIVVVIHGNYEFEPYPQPGHRKLAKELIDLGVYAVIFHHSHIVGPIERYKGRTIAYSLGNFAFSYSKFFGGKLVFPERSFHQILIELGEEDFVHHCDFQPPSAVIYDKKESVLSRELSLQAEFEDFSDAEYLVWFKKIDIKRNFCRYTNRLTSLMSMT